VNAYPTHQTIAPAVDDIPVLMYHSVAADAAPAFRRFTVDPGEFAAQMDYLNREGYRTVTMTELAASRSSGQQPAARTVVLTFDDAFVDFHRTALPIMRRYGFSATLYVPTGYVGATASWLASCGEADREVLSWQALRDISAEGIEIASHSHTHPQLDRLPGAAVRDEARRSRFLLEDNLGFLVAGFAYPYGYWNRAARAAVSAAGYQYGCDVRELMATPSDNVLTLPRLSVNSGIGVRGLARMLIAPPTPLNRRVATAKRIVWQALRHGRTLSESP
jgi:peptidoglycan/xylan/chitin deacetylase (PgdA/CDA1 family)